MNDLWKKEYLHLLLGLQREVWKSLPNPLKDGEVVLVPDDRDQRLNWKMGVVWQLIIGGDGRCRAAIEQMKASLLTRPFNCTNWSFVLNQSTSRQSQAHQRILIRKT